MEEKKSGGHDPSIWEALGIVWDLLIAVLVTALLFALAGVFADRAFGTRFLFKVIAFVLMIPVGYRVITAKGRAVAQRLNSRNQTQNSSKDSNEKKNTP
jgi:uncharacterized protein YacL